MSDLHIHIFQRIAGLINDTSSELEIRGRASVKRDRSISRELYLLIVLIEFNTAIPIHCLTMHGDKAH